MLTYIFKYIIAILYSRSQLFPMYSFLQLHVCPVAALMQSPPFLHGLDLQ